MHVSSTITFGIVAIDDKYYKVVVWKKIPHLPISRDY
jgi:hypothetical protein